MLIADLLLNFLSTNATSNNDWDENYQNHNCTANCNSYSNSYTHVHIQCHVRRPVHQPPRMVSVDSSTPTFTPIGTEVWCGPQKCKIYETWENKRPAETSLTKFVWFVARAWLIQDLNSVGFRSSWNLAWKSISQVKILSSPCSSSLLLPSLSSVSTSFPFYFLPSLSPVLPSVLTSPPIFYFSRFPCS